MAAIFMAISLAENDFSLFHTHTHTHPHTHTPIVASIKSLFYSLTNASLNRLIIYWCNLVAILCVCAQHTNTHTHIYFSLYMCMCVYL